MDKQKLIESIFNTTLEKIIPTSAEIKKLESIVEIFTHIIKNSEIPEEISINFIEPQGSTGLKQTALKNASDIDLFIGLNPDFIINQNLPSKSQQREFLRKKFKDFIKNWLKPALEAHNIQDMKLSYAEHPYLSGKYQNTDIDLVLCFDISAEYLQKHGPITAMDRTPHHTRFIQNSLQTSQLNQVRLLKHFFKCHHSYGDTSAVGRSGFIGYSAELLIVKYNDLITLFENFQDLERKVINCVPNHPLTPNFLKEKSFSQIREDIFPTDFLIILDPTDLNRNVGSSISPRAFYLILDRIKNFLQSPEIKYFERHPLPRIHDIENNPKKLACFFYVDYSLANPDHYTKFRDKLYSLMHQIVRASQEEETNETRFKSVTGELVFQPKKGAYSLAFYTKSPKISSVFLRKGPKVKNEPHATRFKEKHSDVIKKGQFLFIQIKRPYSNFLDFLTHQVRKNGIRDLKIEKIGSALDSDISEIAERSMGNLTQNVLPYIKKVEKFYEG